MIFQKLYSFIKLTILMKIHQKKKFSRDEDIELIKFVSILGQNRWKEIAKLFPDRSTRQLRERWIFYLDPSVDQAPFTPEEDHILLDGQQKFGNHWKIIAKQLFPNRTPVALRNRFHQLQKHKVLIQEKPTSSIYLLLI
jgi:hypothetical protein